jgi:hypothetical protein
MKLSKIIQFVEFLQRSTTQHLAIQLASDVHLLKKSSNLFEEKFKVFERNHDKEVISWFVLGNLH